MAIQTITGNETGSQFIEKLNENFQQGGGGISPIYYVKMERGGLKSNGAMDYTISSFDNYIRSSYLIKVNNATQVLAEALSGCTIYEYNSAFSLIKTSSMGDTFDNNCAYIKICKDISGGVFDERTPFLFDAVVEEVNNVQINSGAEQLVFEVSDGVCTTARLLLPATYTTNGAKVPLIIWCACDGSYTNWDFTIDHVGSSPSSISTQLQYLASQGFAILNVYPWGSYNFTQFPYCGQSGAVPVPVTLRAYEKAVDYVTTRFNISDTDIFQLSWSGSGKLSAYYAINHPTFNLRHIYAFSPVVDGGVWRMCETLGGADGFRGATNSEMSFDGTTEQINKYLTQSNSLTIEQALEFKKLNAGKFAKFSSPQWENLVGAYEKDALLHNHNIDDKVEDSLNWGEEWRTYTNYASTSGAPSEFDDWEGLRDLGIYDRHDLAITSNGAPITIIGAEDDAAYPYLAMEQFIAQLRNGGAEAKIINLPNESTADYGDGHTNGYGHRSPIFYNKMVNATIPFGWWYVVQDINARFLR